MSTLQPPSWRVRSEADLQRLYEAAYADVFRYAVRLAGTDLATAEDLTQDAFVGMVRSVRAGRLDEVTIGWLTTAVRHRFIDLCRRGRLAEGARRWEVSPVASDDVALRDDRTDIALERLKPVERLAVVLHHIEGCSIREVAAAIGKSVSATESLLVRARRTLKIELDKESGNV